MILGNEIALHELEIASKILNRNSDDDIADDTYEALEAVQRAIHTMKNREYTPSEQQYHRELENARSQ